MSFSIQTAVHLLLPSPISKAYPVSGALLVSVAPQGPQRAHSSGKGANKKTGI